MRGKKGDGDLSTLLELGRSKASGAGGVRGVESGPHEECDRVVGGKK